MPKEQKYELVYKTSTTPFFPLCLIAKNYAGYNLNEVFGLPLALPGQVLAVVDRGTVNWFLPKTCQAISVKLLNNFFSDGKHLIGLQKQEAVITKKLLAKIKTPLPQMFSGKNLNSHGEKVLNDIFNLYSTYGCVADIPGMLFQTYYCDIIKKEFFQQVGKQSAREKEEMFSLVFSSPQQTAYEKFLAAAYNHIIKNKSANNLPIISDKYYWVIHDYLGAIIDVAYLKKELAAMKRKPLDDLKQELKDTQDRVKRIKALEVELPKVLRRKVKMIHSILYLYNERKKEVLNKVNIYVRQIIEQKYPAKSMSQLHQIYQLTSAEIIELLQGKVIKDIDKRGDHWVYALTTKEITKGDQQYFKLITAAQKTKTLTGSPASGGRAEGIVSVVLDVSQMPKFKDGQILVAPFTNVNYLPTMRRASAILTETGGLTSHAAIVSRELKKPCVVGIKNLIACLTDGDKVMIDADTGTVRILS